LIVSSLLIHKIWDRKGVQNIQIIYIGNKSATPSKPQSSSFSRFQ
jgi:hypothetical protein